MLAIAMDDIVFSLDYSQLMNKFKCSPSTTFSVNIFGKLKSFVGWTINISNTVKIVDQRTMQQHYSKNMELREAQNAA